MRIFLPEIPDNASSFTVKGEKARYLSVVLRCAPGDRLSVILANSTSRQARVASVSRQGVELELEGTPQVMDTESPLRIVLFQGLLKGERMDLVVQKTTELGVTEIVPVVTERSQVRHTRKNSRWTKIAEAAAQQCGRSVIPLLHDTVSFGEALELYRTLALQGIIFWEGGGEDLGTLMAQAGRTPGFSIFTGPEGGYSSKEVEVAAESGIRAATLGRRILRAETAAVVTVALIQFGLGDLSQR